MQRSAFLLALILAWTPALFSQVARTQLKAVNPVVAQIEDGQALEPGFALRQGETAFFSVEVQNYKVGENGEVRLTAHVQGFDPHGVAVAPPDEIVIGTTLSQEDKDWKPKIRSQIQVPPIAPAGAYTIRYDVTDGLTRSKTSGEAKFKVAGINVEPSTQLVIRNLGFYRGQDDETALGIAAYRPGDMVWVKFDVTGFKYGEQNAIDVSYDVSVSNGEGKQLFSQENAAVEKSQAFYPQPWVAGIFNLTLKAGTSPGRYTLSIIAHDSVGNQTATAKADFKVE